MIAFAILGAFTLGEALGGYFANSIALIAEAARMLTDTASLILANRSGRGRVCANAHL